MSHRHHDPHGHGHTHEPADHPGHFHERALLLDRDFNQCAFNCRHRWAGGQRQNGAKTEKLNLTGPKFKHTFPGNSLTILRAGAGK